EGQKPDRGRPRQVVSTLPDLSRGSRTWRSALRPAIRRVAEVTQIRMECPPKPQVTTRRGRRETLKVGLSRSRWPCQKQPRATRARVSLHAEAPHLELDGRTRDRDSFPSPSAARV